MRDAGNHRRLRFVRFALGVNFGIDPGRGPIANPVGIGADRKPVAQRADESRADEGRSEQGSAGQAATRLAGSRPTDPQPETSLGFRQSSVDG
jgi:hypothetical protein